MKLIVGNWKMNQKTSDIKAFFEELPAATQGWIAPQSLHIPLCLSLSKNIKIGAQNSAQKSSGAFTGEVSAEALKDLGAHFVILGHSERRQIFKETHSELSQKTQTAQAVGLKVIFCVGETLEEREAGTTMQVVKTQLTEGLKNVAADAEFVIAYEPVWAIGTGKVATPEQAQEVHAFIRQELKALYPSTGEKMRILYGGSVKPDNVHSLMSQKDINGALVGGASLKAKDFLALCQQ
jgi:triosephosphate isomerase (TIM)